MAEDGAKSPLRQSHLVRPPTDAGKLDPGLDLLLLTQHYRPHLVWRYGNGGTGDVSIGMGLWQYENGIVAL